MIKLKQEAKLQELYQSHYGKVFRTLFGMTGNQAVAEELTQETFLKAWKGLPLFSFRSSLSTWLYQVALNTGRDWLRSHRIAAPLNDELTTEMDTPEKRAVQEALMELESESRELLVLHYYEGFAQDEMARILQIPEGTVKSRLFTAKAKLKTLLLARGFDV